MDALNTWEEFFAHYEHLTETPYAPLEKRFRLLVAGVNGSGKSQIERLFTGDIVYGMSGLFIADVVQWWREILTKDERKNLYDTLVKEEDRHYFDPEHIDLSKIIPAPGTPEDEAALIYKRKDAFGKIISHYLQIIRNKDVIIRDRAGYPEVVVERLWQQTLHLRSCVFTGVRTLSDFKYLIEHALLEHIEMGIVYVDSDTRQKDNLRGPTERDLVTFRHDLLRLFQEMGGKVWVIESNCDYEQYKANVKNVTDELRTFLHAEA